MKLAQASAQGLFCDVRITLTGCPVALSHVLNNGINWQQMPQISY